MWACLVGESNPQSYGGFWSVGGGGGVEGRAEGFGWVWVGLGFRV